MLGNNIVDLPDLILDVVPVMTKSLADIDDHIYFCFSYVLRANSVASFVCFKHFHNSSRISSWESNYRTNPHLCSSEILLCQRNKIRLYARCCSVVLD